MSITYPLSLPAAAGIRDIVLRKSPVVGVTRSPYSGVQQVQVHPGQWWEADIVLPPLRNANAASWEAFLGSLNGMEGTFLLGDPYRETPRGSAAQTPGTPVVDGAHTIRVNEIDITGADPLAVGYLLAGDYFQLGTGASSRLHQVLQDMNTDSDGAGTLVFWPKTRAALSGGEAIDLTAPKGVFRLAGNETEVSKSPGNISSISFRCVEAL